jgi:SAM-dependent methyltransferase
MQYDPIKKDAGNIFSCCREARILFFFLLNMLLLRSWYVRREIRKWEGSAPAGASVLDAGSGFGQYVYFLSRLRGRYRVKGVDIKEEEVNTCERFFGGKRSQGRISFEIADLNTFTEPESHDLILCVDVLEHIKDDILVMENLCRSLRPGGMLIVSTPSDRGGSDVHVEGEDSFIGEHVRDGYGKEEISGKLLSAGFSRAETDYTYGKPGQLAWKLSMKYPIKLLNMGRIFFLLLPLYYLVTLPLALLLNFLDLRGEHESGTGLIVRAVK